MKLTNQTIRNEVQRWQQEKTGTNLKDWDVSEVTDFRHLFEVTDRALRMRKRNIFLVSEFWRRPENDITGWIICTSQPVDMTGMFTGVPMYQDLSRWATQPEVEKPDMEPHCGRTFPKLS